MKQHNLSLDVLKVFMAFLIVALHRTLFVDCGAVLWGFSDAIVHIAVPTFFIINGYYFASVKGIDDFKKVIKRWLKLYLIWTFIYGYYIIRFSHSFSAIITDVIFGYFHLWYVINTIYAFVIIMLLRSTWGGKVLVYVSVLAAVTGIALAYLSYSGAGIPSRLFRNFFFFSLPFIMIGYKIKRTNYQPRFNLPALIAIGFILLLGESYIGHLLLGAKFRIELCFSLYIICPAMFLLCLNNKHTYQGKYLADLSTGIYLTHQLTLSIINKTPFIKTIYELNTINQTLINFVFALIISHCIIYLQRTTQIRLL